VTPGPDRLALPRARTDRAYLTPRELGGYWLELAGVWSIALAWPVYQNIASGAEALTGLALRRLDLLLIVVLTSILVPTLAVLAESLARKLGGERLRRPCHAVMVALIVAVFTWQQFTDSPGLLRYLLPVAVTTGVVLLLLRSAFGQSFFRILGLAVPVVIVMFCLRYPVWAEVAPHEKQVPEKQLDATTPVVLVIFDELPLASLENDRGEIDDDLFPAFGDLASSSTWYPDMTGVADQTTFAVPSIMTGSSPVSEFTTEPPPPGLPDFPNGVCSVAQRGGYTVHAYEPITDLCPRTFGIGSRVTAAIRRGTGATDELLGKELDPAGLTKAGSNLLAAPFEQPWPEYGDERDQAVDWFIDGMPDSERSLSVLHIALPHIDWDYLPDGTRYVSDRFTSAASLTSPPTRPEIDRDMQQMMLQLSFTDSQLARIVGKMKADGIWDDSLFIVTADHGGAFLPGGSRRIAGEANAGWIMPVPLFVKYPGQDGGRVVRGAASSKDIAPTVYEAIGAEDPPRVDGESLAGKSRLGQRDEYEFRSALGDFAVSRQAVVRQLDRARRQRNELFGGGSLYAIGGHQDLIGESPSARHGLTEIEFTDDSPRPLTDVDLDSPERPSYFQAVLDGPEPEPPTIAVALNGTIVATTSAWTDAASGQVMTGVNLPPGAFVEGDNAVQLYEVR
jgi:hypothetical protein